MYSWKAIRNVCLALLLIPIGHFAWLVARDTLQTLQDSPAAWQGEMQAYTRADQRATLPDQPVLVVGGRRVKLWQGLPELLAPQPVLMRGLGSAIVEDIAHYYDRLIGFYRPATVVLLPGNSEFHLRDQKDAPALVAAIGALEAEDARLRENGRLVVFVPVKSPFYPQDFATIDEAKQSLQAWASERPRVTLLDPNPLLQDLDGTPSGRYFRPGGLHLNDQGYARLGLLLQDALAPGQAQ
ncbi:SGNH/GDSL hydrolase family protein [Haliea sp.]